MGGQYRYTLLPFREIVGGAVSPVPPGIEAQTRKPHSFIDW